MCGIAGIVGRERGSLPAALRRLRHRGPDASGRLDVPGMATAIGHVRLAIIDLDARSNQPFESPCGRWALTFNGEIYNHVELRQQLERRGTTFRTTSDTEVLLHWLAAFGEAGLASLEGMYAFCLVDRRERRLLLARDPIGEKPLYYAFAGPRSPWRFAFASELKGLLGLPGLDTSLDDESVADWLRFLYTAPPRTLYRGIRELAPGHRLHVDADDPREDAHRFYDLEARCAERPAGNRDEAAAGFLAAFAGSLRLRLRSDVPLGIFLSGGLDSNSILALARELEPAAELQTFTARYAGSSSSRLADESGVAARAAREHGVPNEAITLRDDVGFLDAVERVVSLFDQPFGNATAVIADQIAAQAAQSCKVALIGDGGDEILAGYPRHRALALHARLQSVPRSLRSALGASCSLLSERGRLATSMRRLKAFARGLDRPLAQGYLDWSTYVDADGVARALGRGEPTAFQAGLVELFERNQRDPLRAAALVDLSSFVPFNLLQAADRTSMAHPIELRAPFLAPRLIEATLSLPAGLRADPRRHKALLRDALGDRIPPFIAGQKKRPFNPPMQGWVRSELPAIEDHLAGPGSRSGGVLDPRFVRGELDAFREGRRDNSTLLFGLCSLESWLRRSPARALALAR